ncbi:MAG: sigma 54-interacting transcriptional regulator [Deltaproteobacteria bacterium]|nr:sigma 54-interacting transcriptional regulator [Deltaproteobacteria bacterium]
MTGEVASTVAHIVVREPGRVAYSIPLKNGFRIGRDQTNDLALEDRFVSREHLRFDLRDGDSFFAVDTESRHGVQVNGQRIEREARLNDGDQIAVGRTLILFYESDEPVVEVGSHTLDSSPSDDSGATPASAFASPLDVARAPVRARGDDDARRRLDLLLKMGRTVGLLDDSEKLLGEMLETALDLLGCDRGIVGVLNQSRSTKVPVPGPGLVSDDSWRGVRCISRTRHHKGASGHDIVVSRSILEILLGRREGVIVSDSSSSARAERPPTFVTQRVLSAIGAPLQTHARLHGFLYVDDQGRNDRFTVDDLDFLMALGRLCADALESAERYQQATAIAETTREWRSSDEILGSSENIARLRSEVGRYAESEGTNILILGESGSGKELVARTIHRLSPRSEGPFVPVNCAAIPETMIESELFGHEKGAFTGATRDRRGKFFLANRGTLFLDEIGDLSLSAQAKVLRAIEEGEVQPLGSERTFHVNVRLVSATHRDLAAEVKAGRFREDLYYRLNVVELVVPPLRERGDDVALLAAVFLKRAALKMGKDLQAFAPAALDAFRQYSWPGNVRELLNEVERSAILAEPPFVEASELSRKLNPTAVAALHAPTLAERFTDLEQTERDLVRAALADSQGNIAGAARLLGITRIMMKRRLDRLEASPEPPAKVEE